MTSYSEPRRGGHPAGYTAEQYSEQLDAETLAAITSFIDANGYPPSIRDLCKMMGRNSAATMKRRVDSLVTRGWITTGGPGVPRSIRVMKTETEDL